MLSPIGVGWAEPGRFFQNPQKVAVGIKTVFLRRFNQTVDGRAALSAARCVGKKPVFPVMFYKT